MKTPTFKELIEPLFSVLQELGRSATYGEIRDKIIEKLELPDEIVDAPHVGVSSIATELDYRLNWARSYLRRYGAIENTQRGVVMITPAFRDAKSVNAQKVVREVRKKSKQKSKNPPPDVTPNQDDNPENDGLEPPEEQEPWRLKLGEILRNINPFAFERLAQLLLRECGFSQVSVTKKTGDGGIDGTGKLRFNGLVSFNVAFQCKRYAGHVSAEEIRNFRGSLTANIEKGIFITTGTFTNQAREDASNAGKQQIDLIDGEDFIEMLIRNRLGVKEKTIFEVDEDFFNKI